jgi:hypothetical protein
MALLLRTPAALAVLLGVWAVCVLLYLVRPRPRETVVPLLQLWEALLQREPSLRIVPRLRQLTSLALALVVSALLVRSLLAPDPTTPDATLGPLLIMIDAGSSMQATDVAPTRLAAAKQRVLQLLAAEPSARPISIARWSARAELRCAETSDRVQLRHAIESIGLSDASSDLTTAVSLAERMLAGRAHAAVWLVSDGAFLTAPDRAPELSTEIAWYQLPIGRESRNLGLRSLRVRRYPSNRNRAEARLVLENAGDRAESVEVGLFADSAPIALDRLALPAHATLARNYAELPADAQRIEARLTAHDALAADDRAYALLPARRPARVLLVGTGNRYLEAALLLDESLRVDRQDPQHYRDATGYDIAIFDRFVPAGPIGVPGLFIAPKPSSARPDYPLRMRGLVERPFVERSERDHPLLRGVELRDVNIARALVLEPQSGDRVIAAGRASPLILTGTRDHQPIVVLSFDVRDSDLPLRIAWPMLILNALDQLHPRALDYVPALQVGIEQAIPIDPGARAAVITGPGSAPQTLLVDGHVTRLTPEQIGFYDLRGNDRPPQLLAAERRPGKSIAIKPGRIPGTSLVPAAATRAATSSFAWPLLVVLAWLVVFVEWLCHQRRWTL